MVEIVVQTRAVAGADSRLHLRGRRHHPVQKALVLAPAAGACLRRRADAEELIEHRARIADHRQRLFRRSPADRVGVGARVAVEAAARLVDALDAQLHRRDRRVLAPGLRVNLIERRAGVHVRALCLVRVRLREEHGRRSEMISADLRRGERLRVAAVRVADDGEVVAPRLERGHGGGRQIERGPGVGRRPQVLLRAERRGSCNAVDHFHRDEPLRPCGAAVACESGEGGRHRVEPR